MKKPKTKFVEPETIRTHVWEDEIGRLVPYAIPDGYRCNARIIREKDYQRLLKAARK